MNRNQLLKVCKIDSISFASFAIKQSADFLGVHVLEKENIGEHLELVNFIKSQGGKTIIVTKIKNEETIVDIVKTYNPEGIQLHYEIETELVSKIRDRFPELLIFGVFSDDSHSHNFSTLDKIFDHLIYDTSYVGGTNERNKYSYLEKFPESLRLKTLLAGGITVDRIKELNYLNAGGYDIQSYFRLNEGLSFKNLDKVCDLLKFPRKRKLSVSLTDIPLKDIKQIGSYYLDPMLEYHLDFSPGTLYTSFNTSTNSIEEKQQYLSVLPYSIHLFLKDIDELNDKIKKLNEKYPLNIIRIFVQYSREVPRDFFLEKLTYVSKALSLFFRNSEAKYDRVSIKRTSDIKIVPSIFFKDLQFYLEQSIDSPIISIIVPNPEDKDHIDSFISFFNSKKESFKGKEIWFDRSLNTDYIKFLCEKLGFDFNFIIGKEVINDWNKINFINEQLLNQE